MNEEITKEYIKFSFLVPDIFDECMNSGYTKEGAAGKLKYELFPVASTRNSKIILYAEMSYLFAKEDLQESFDETHELLLNMLQQESLEHFLSSVTMYEADWEPKIYTIRNYSNKQEDEPDNRQELIGKRYVYNGSNELYKGEQVEVVSLHPYDRESVVVFDCETAERFLGAKVTELTE